jgi:acetyl-CoA synthase
MGFVSDEWYATAAELLTSFPGYCRYSHPEITLPASVLTEPVVSNIPHEKLVAKAVEVRGLKV